MTSSDRSSATDLPSRVYLDTAIVVAAMMRGANNHIPARDFCMSLASASSHVYFSSLLQVELLQALVAIGNDPLQLPGRVRRRYRLHRWGESDIIRLTWLEHGIELLERFLDQFVEVDEIVVTPQLVSDAILQMARYKLRSYDALHVATAMSLGVSHFATCDADFLRLVGTSQLTIHLIRDV